MMGNSKKISIGVGILIGCFFLYTFWFRGGDDTSALKVESGVNGVIEREFINELNELKHLTIDEAFLQSQLFTDLIDFTVPVKTEPVGRPNPFAPLTARGAR